MSNAIGLLETRGFTASLEAADIMLKNAGVKLAGKERISGDYVTIIVTGTPEQVKLAVKMGAEAALKVGELTAAHVITDPHKDLSIILPFFEKQVPLYAEETVHGKIDSGVLEPKLDSGGHLKRAESEKKIESVLPDPGGAADTADSLIEEVKKIITPERKSKPAPAKNRKTVPAGAAVVEQITPPQVMPNPADVSLEAEADEIPGEKENSADADEKIKKQRPKKAERKKTVENKSVPATLSLFDHNYHNETIERLKKEALGIKPVKTKQHNQVTEAADVDVPEKPKSAAEGSGRWSADIDELSRMNVHQLRRAARDYENFPIKGRQISKANRDVLLGYFREL